MKILKFGNNSILDANVLHNAIITNINITKKQKELVLVVVFSS